jgi:hypothetical protein
METLPSFVPPLAWRRLVSLVAAGPSSSNTLPHRSGGRSGTVRMHVYEWVCHHVIFNYATLATISLSIFLGEPN